MALEDHRKISLYDEAKAGLSSLFQQTAQVGLGFLVMLLVTGGNPPGWVVTLSFFTGIGFVAWSENKRLAEFEAGKLPLGTPVDIKQPTATSEGYAAVEVPQSNVDLINAENYPFQKLIELKLAKIAAMTPDQDLAGADLNRADLSGANLIGVNLFGVNLFGANLSDADLRGAKLLGANLSSADLLGANLRRADLSGAKLIGASLSSAKLFGANLSDANLSGANLLGANLRRANLLGANLRYANLSGADLRGANLIRANLSDANVKNTEFGWNDGLSEEMKLDLKQRGAIFQDSPGEPAAIVK